MIDAATILACLDVLWASLDRSTVVIFHLNIDAHYCYSKQASVPVRNPSS